MRKMKGIFAAAVIVMGLSLAACGSSDSGSSSSGSSSSGSAASSSSEGFSFTSGSTKIEMNEDASKVVEELGDPDDYFESESCAFEGLDKVYTYPGFHLNTYPVDDKDYVLSVDFMDDTVETDEGISIGSTKDEVTEAYGEPTEETSSSLVYEKGDTEMTIGLDGDSVSSLEISAVTEE